MKREEWETLAQIDPLWAICTDPTKKQGGWDQQEFFKTGQYEVARVFSCLDKLDIHPDLSSPALDFGCGVGRLTQALGRMFDSVYGVDCSPTMINLAQKMDGSNPGLHFLHLKADNLAPFQDAQFGFIYSSIVLQHIRPQIALGFIGEFVRVLNPDGVMVFQLAETRKTTGVHWLDQSLVEAKRVIRFRTRLRDFKYSLDPNSPPKLPIIRGYGIKESDVCRKINESGGVIKDIQLTNSLNENFNGDLQFLKQEPDCGWISKQYCVVKN